MTIASFNKVSVIHYLTVFFLLLISLLIFGRTASYQFVNYDDPALVYENPQVKSFDLKQIFTSVVAEDYIPLTVASYALDHALFGMNPTAFHLHNVILHCLNVLLVYWLAWLVSSGSLSTAALTAFLFAAHPLHVESVAWVAERKDVLSGFFSLMALLLYWKYSLARRWLLYTGALVFFICALLAKFMAVSLPAILLMFEIHRSARLKKIITNLTPFALIALIFTYIHLSLHNSESGSSSISLVRGFDSLVFYLTKTLVPLSLSAFYEKNVTLISMWEYILAGAIIFALVWALWKAPRMRLQAAAGVLFFLATLLPVMQIIPFGNDFAFADRFMYFPSIGLFYALGVLSQRRWAVGIFTVLGLLWLFLSWQRVPIWQSSKSLWADAVATSPKSAVARNNLGLVHLEEAQPELAIKELTAATQLRPGYAEPYINLGLAYLDLRRVSEAEAALQEALKIKPRSSKAHVNMALVMEAQNRLEMAVIHYLKALDHDQDLGSARYNLGVIYYRLGQVDKALALFRETIAQDPYLAEAYHGIGVILKEKGELESAMRSFEKAIERDGTYLAPRLQIAAILGQQGNNDQALREIQEVQRIQKELESQPPRRSRRGP